MSSSPAYLASTAVTPSQIPVAATRNLTFSGKNVSFSGKKLSLSGRKIGQSGAPRKSGVVSATIDTQEKGEETKNETGRGTETEEGEEKKEKSGKGSQDLKSPLEGFLGLDYYQVLGVSVNSSPSEIRKAYWKLQKMYHPDVAGEEGHSLSLLLNEAYNTLMDESRRVKYESEWKTAESIGFVGFTGKPRSEWNGPDWPQGIFVEETLCVGCQECVFEAPNTFSLDSETAKARVKMQWGDTEAKIKSASEACPVKCIHTVNREDLPYLEFVVQPRRREGEGVWGGGWEEPQKGQVFGAAKSFRRRFERQKMESGQRKNTPDESPAQKAARKKADRETQKKNPFWWIWGFGVQTGPFGGGVEGEEFEKEGKREKKNGNFEFSFKKMFGRASTSQILNFKVSAEEVPRVVAFVQDWASLWASSSELPLPLPFRADPLPLGVRLSLISTFSGSIESVGSLLISLEKPQFSNIDESETLSFSEISALGGPLGSDKKVNPEFPEFSEFPEFAGNSKFAGIPGFAGNSKFAGNPGFAGTPDSAGNPEIAGNPEFAENEMWVLSVKREGAANDKALPGENRILNHLKDALFRRDNVVGYEAYHIPRKV